MARTAQRQKRWTETRVVGGVEFQDKYLLNVHYELSMHKGNRKPYFSLTGGVYQNGRDYMYGCIHEEILKHYPDLKPLADLHLCDMDGCPSHEGGNVFYWLQQSLRNEYGTKIRTRYQQDYEKHKDAEYYLKLFCSDMRITEAQGIEYREYAEKLFSEPSRMVQLCGAAAEAVTIDIFKAWWNRSYEEQKPRWKAEAEFAIKEFDVKVVCS